MDYPMAKPKRKLYFIRQSEDRIRKKFVCGQKFMF